MKHFSSRQLFSILSRHRLSFILVLSLFVFHIGTFTLAKDSNVSSLNIFQDSDNDGLSDTEEKIYGTDPHNPDTDGDGYTDGAEVLGGYDPLKKAPGDKLVSTTSTGDTKDGKGGDTTTNTNLTQALSSQVAGLMQESSLTDGQTPSTTDINTLISETLGQQNAGTLELPTIDPSTIKIKKQDYSKNEKVAKVKEDTRMYMTSLAYIITNNSPIPIKSDSDATSALGTLTQQAQIALSGADTKFLDDMATRSQSALTQIEQLEVPENMLSLHTKMLQLALYGLDLKKGLAPNDPVSYVYTLSKGQVYLTSLMDIFTQYQTALQQAGITDAPSLF